MPTSLQFSLRGHTLPLGLPLQDKHSATNKTGMQIQEKAVSVFNYAPCHEGIWRSGGTTHASLTSALQPPASFRGLSILGKTALSNQRRGWSAGLTAGMETLEERKLSYPFRKLDNRDTPHRSSCMQRSQDTNCAILTSQI